MLIRTPRRLRAIGFTILEILIAIVVLVLGITGIVALFPTAIESGNKTVEDTYAATITQSVVDAIAVGLRESRYTYRSPDGTVWTYFVFNHDGVIDRPPGEPEKFTDGKAQIEGGGSVNDEIWKKDHCVILPQSNSGAPENFDSNQEPFFLYPLPAFDGASEPHVDVEQRNLAVVTKGNLVDNFDPDTSKFGAMTAEGTVVQWFPKVYQLGRYRDTGNLPSGADPGDIRPEYRGGDLVVAAASGGGTTTGSTGTAQSIALDPYPTYSFAFAIKRARVDTHGAGGSVGADGVVDGNDPYSNSLYELRIYIFKNFDMDAAAALRPGATGAGGDRIVPRTNVPIRTFITLISI